MPTTPTETVQACTVNILQRAFTTLRDSVMEATGANALLAQVSAKSEQIKDALGEMLPDTPNLPTFATEFLVLKEKVGTAAFTVAAADFVKKWGNAVSNIQELVNNILTIDVCSLANIEATGTNSDGSYITKAKAPVSQTPGGTLPAESEALPTTSEDTVPVEYSDTQAKYVRYQQEVKSIIDAASDKDSFAKKEERLEADLYALKIRAGFSNMAFDEYVERYSSDVSIEEQASLEEWYDLEEERAALQKKMSSLNKLAKDFETKIAQRPSEDPAEIRKEYDAEVAKSPVANEPASKQVGDVIVASAQKIRDFIQFKTQSSSVSTTGFAAPPGAKITAYAYPGDPWIDSNSAKGLGFRNLQLSEGDFALSRDIRAVFEANNINNTQYVLIRLANGITLKGRWRDVTANSIKDPDTGATRQILGRVDIYSPSARPSYDGVKVVSFGIVPEDDPALAKKVRP